MPNSESTTPMDTPASVQEKSWGLLVLWFVVAVIVIVLDQVTKSAITSRFVYDEVYTITPFFDLTLRHNYGAAFSLFHDQGGWQRWFFTIVASAVSLMLIVWIAKIGAIRDKWLECLALGLILGGAVGNLYDRVTLGYVIDFLVLHYKMRYAWPAFNVADAAICLGAGLMILEMFRSAKKT